ncbi:MAG: GDP-mannose-dependent alpha-(1-6)-phosphatidylinositol monomannoside mannosyltransferase [Bacteroidetes bacterium ADurb.BinA261]|jgi:phosphatidylinositol alpha-1,6-mannosyltransferase|nr:MAG: GDP-mannose-dependent alpha-(1-6)-phosphatidylinositol monomannoside mannosyltransferase [Bacteroidetes bacterium ADurb.BinA261]
MQKEVLCITHKYPPFVGGMETQSYELIRGLSAFYSVHILAYKGDENKVWWFFRLPRRVRNMLRNYPNIQLIHLNDGSMGVASLWLQRFTNIPVIVTYHGLDITYPLTFFQKQLVPRLGKYSGAVCVSEFTRQECLRRGFDTTTTFTVNNGVDHHLADIPFDPTIVDKLQNDYGIDVCNKRVIVSTGRPVKRKGFSWFLKNVIPHLDNDILFLMMGPLKKEQTVFERFLKMLPGKIAYKLHLLLGFSTDRLEVIEQLKKQKNAYHLGKVSGEDLMQLLSLADLFVMPNLSIPGDVEGFGLVALEASMRGTYVLASAIDGITDAVVDGKNGSLLPAGDASAWINKIHELLSDEDALQTLSEQGKEFTRQHFSWKIMTEGYVEIFNRFIDK